MLLGVDGAADHGHQHVFIVAAVEHREFARPRHALVDAPEVIVLALGARGRLPADGVHAQRAHAAEHGAYGAVLARRVGALQHHEQLEAPVGIEKVLQRVEFHGQRIDHGLVLGFFAQRKRLGRGVERGQIDLRQGLAGFAVFAIEQGRPLRRLPLRPETGKLFAVAVERLGHAVLS